MDEDRKLNEENDFNEADFEDINLDDVDLEEDPKTEEEIKELEKQAVENADNLEDLDSFLDKYKEPTKEEMAKESKKGGKKKDAKPPAEKKEEPKKEPYKGPKIVKVYGQELFVEDDPEVTLEDIRKKIVDDYKFGEFASDKTFMSLDENTGIVVPVIKFKDKG